MARKTVDVDMLIETANRLLALPDTHGRTEDLSPQFRQGVIAMVEAALHAADRYKGYTYLSSEVVTADEPHEPHTTYLRVGYDGTRRRYVR